MRPLHIAESFGEIFGGSAARQLDTNWIFFEMAIMPFLYRGFFKPKLSYHRNVSLVVYLPHFYFSFCQKTISHLYKHSRLTEVGNGVLSCWQLKFLKSDFWPNFRILDIVNLPKILGYYFQKSGQLAAPKIIHHLNYILNQIKIIILG